jgi:hypothetical protein
MKTKKQLIAYSTVCLVLSFVVSVCAATIEIRTNIANTNANPLPVTEVKKYPIQKKVTAKFPGSSLLSMYTNATIYTVPLDKRLIIEYFSCRSRGSNSTSYSCNISTGTYPDDVEHLLPTTMYGHYGIVNNSGNVTNPPAFMSAGQRVQIYADPGTEVLVGAYRQNQAIASLLEYSDEYITFSVSGYLVDIQ